MVLAVQNAGTLDVAGSVNDRVAFANDSVVVLDGSGTADVTGAVFTGSMSSSDSFGGGDIVEGACETGAEVLRVQDSTFDDGIALGHCSTSDTSITIDDNSFYRPPDTTFIVISAPASKETGQLIIAGNTFSPNGDRANTQKLPAIQVDGWPDQGIALFGPAANVFTGQGPDRVVQVSDSSVPFGQTWQVGPAGGEVLAVLDSTYQNGPAIVVSGTLVLEPGAIVKNEAGVGIDVVAGGHLDVDGSAAHPVLFTSFADSTVGGDSNGQPSSKGTPAGKGGNYFASIENSEDTYINISHATFRDGLWAIQLSGIEPVVEGSITISRCLFQAEVALGDYAKVEPGYAITMTNNTFDFNGAPSANFVLGGHNTYDPAAEQPALNLLNVDPAGVSLQGPTANRFTGHGAGRVIAVYGTVIPEGQSWTVDPSTGAVLAPVTDTDYLPNPGIDVSGVLTLMPGTAVKSADSAPGIQVETTGTLHTSGVTFDTITDNSVDGNSDGAGSLVTPIMGDYGDAVLYNDTDASISGDVFEYATTAIASPNGGSVAISGDTFKLNDTAIADTADFGTSASAEQNTFYRDQVSIDVSSFWEPFGADPVSCQFLGTLAVKGNNYDGSGSPPVTKSDYDAIQAAMKGTDVKAVPDGWTKLIAPGQYDVLPSWGVYPCAQPKNPYTAVAIPMTF